MADATHLDVLELYDGFVGEWLPVSGPVRTASTYVNRVYDSTAVDLVRWESSGSADSAGASYPGPGTFGVHTSDYCVETIR